MNLILELLRSYRWAVAGILGVLMVQAITNLAAQCQLKIVLDSVVSNHPLPSDEALIADRADHDQQRAEQLARPTRPRGGMNDPAESTGPSAPDSAPWSTLGASLAAGRYSGWVPA